MWVRKGKGGSKWRGVGERRGSRRKERRGREGREGKRRVKKGEGCVIAVGGWTPLHIQTSFSRSTSVDQSVFFHSRLNLTDHTGRGAAATGLGVTQMRVTAIDAITTH